MKSTSKIYLNLQMPNYNVIAYAVQGDVMSREITAILYDGQTPFTPSVGALGTIRYKKPDGTSGFYDTLEDGETVAVTWEDNVATIRLAEQVLTVAGNVIMQLSFYNADAERLSTFNFILTVEQNPYTDEEFESTDYYSVLTARIAAVLGAVAHAPQINELNHWILWDEDEQDYYDSGVNATGPQGIQGIQGIQGTSITSVTKKSGTGAGGTVDEYNVNLSDGTIAGTFGVYNGEDGQGAPGSTLPQMDGTASAGSAIAYSREDHVHPSDTSKLNASEFVITESIPEMDGTASAGVSTEVARADHIHPSDTSKLDASEFILSDNEPYPNGNASSGISNEVSRADHVHPFEYTRTTSSKTGITWNIYKFAEGLMIQCGTYTFNWTNSGTVLAGTTGALRTSPVVTVQFGASFNSQPMVSVTPSVNGTVLTIAGYARAISSSVDLYVLSGASGSISTQVSIIAIGRWK